MSDDAGAESDCRKALELLRPFDAEGRDNPDYARLRAAALHNLAVATTYRGADRQEALAYYRESEALRRGLVRRPDADDSDRHELASTLGSVGALYLDLGRFREADAAYWESHRLREKLAADNPRDLGRKYQLARSWDNFGGYQARQGALETALHFYRQAQKLRREMHQRQPDNKEYTLALTGSLNRVVELELLIAREGIDEPRVAESARALDDCSALLAALIDDSRGDPAATARAYSRLAECHSLKARLALFGARPDAAALERALAAARAAWDALEKVKEQRKRLNAGELYVLAASQAISIEIYLQTRAEHAKNTADLYHPCRQNLTQAINDGDRHLAAQEMARDRAFRSVARTDWFEALMKQAALGAPGKGGEKAGKGP
jgi:hypothetical protein